MKIFNRTQTKNIKIDNVQLGGQNKVLIQSMTNIKTEHYQEVLNQIRRLYHAGCDLVRVSILDDKDIVSLQKLIIASPIPIIADIHFDYELAIKAINVGVKKIRLNPGNLLDPQKVKEIVGLAKIHNVVIRVGVNSGSLPIDIENKYGNNEKAIIKAAQKYIKILEDEGFFNIVISLKSSNPLTTIKAYKLAAKHFQYPLHVGVTEAGASEDGIIKSTIGIAPVLMSGIGDTIRVSLTNDPEQEIYVAKKILNILGLRNDMVDLISCPTCGRLEYDLFQTVDEIKQITKNIQHPIKISILGCVVNGIGEGRHADIGVAGNKEFGILFKKGKIYKQVPKNQIIDELKKLIDEFIQENYH